ncbi:hypothetical protein QP172_03345 [Corynebacterium coyleae]|uniref:hypothetical protein n=1 Tax=Corynebacterium TaxID=1716 RepID=UPI00114D2C2A|nr:MULTISPECIES: hypothetical protein [Corynebacterium]MDK6492766.1 hypothetical protein [Corynebacterium coyleae]
MSVIIGRVKRPGYSSTINLKDLESYTLYDNEPTRNYYSRGAAEVAIFDYGSAQEAELLHRDDDCLVFGQGVLTANARGWLPEILMHRELRGDPTVHPESACGFALYRDEIRVFASCPGTDGFVYADLHDSWVFTNHLPLLYPLIEPRTKLDPIAMAWPLQKHHNFDYAHHIQGVNRTRPGSKWIVSKDSTTEVSANQSWGTLTERIDDRDLPAMVEAYASSVSDYILGTQCGKSLSLSGGKDSRAILGLLGDEIYGKWISFSTGGEPYSPDVMAAVDLMEIAGLGDSHHVSSPPLVVKPQDLSANIARDLMTDFSLSSLADIRWVGVRPSIVLGGHEYGTKGSNSLTLRALIDREMGQLANAPLLNQDGAELLSTRYRASLERELEGVPPEKIEVAWKLKYRLPLLTGSTLTANNATAAEVHPFLDYRALRIILGSAPEFTKAQAFHYLLNRRMSRQIENAPFANDRWPDALQQYLSYMGLRWRGKAAGPYRFNSAFPSQSSFGRYNWRIELFKGARPKMLEFLRDGEFDGSLVDVNAMTSLIEQDEQKWSFFNLYQLGSILRFCLLNLAGVEVINTSKQDSLVTAVKDFITPHNPNRSAPSQSDIDRLLTENLKRAELSIAELAKQLRDLEDENSVGFDPVASVSLLESKQIHGGQLQMLFPDLGRFGELKRVPDDLGRLNFTGMSDENGVIEISGYALKGESTTLLIGIEGSENDNVEGLVWSPGGFHYQYLKPDPTGYFQISVRIESRSGQSCPFFIQRWYSPGAAYVAVR